MLAAGGAQLGDAEIEHFQRPAPRDEEIGRLDVAVHDTLRVCGVEGIGHLHAQFQHLVGRQRPLRDALLQRLAIEQFHHHELLALMIADVVERADVRVVQARDHPCFAQEALHDLAIGLGLVGQELDRHLAAEAGVFGLVHHPHAARAEARQHAVVRDGFTNHKFPVSGSSSTSRIFFASCIGVNGFCKKGLPSSSTPVFTIASSV